MRPASSVAIREIGIAILLTHGKLPLDNLVSLIKIYMDAKKLSGIEEDSTRATVKKRILTILREDTSAMRSDGLFLKTNLELQSAEVSCLGFGPINTIEDCLLALTCPTPKLLLARAMKSLNNRVDGGHENNFSSHEVVIEVR
jgi:hypothetical protein